MSGLEGKVAFITGAARGQGRAHAVRLASEGADILGVDICAPIESMDYPNASKSDLDETVALVEAEGRKMVGLVADVRDRVALQRAFDEGMASLGRLDIVIANAGWVRLTAGGDEDAVWNDIVATNLTGAWNTVSVALPKLQDNGESGGSIVLTSSTAGLRPPKQLHVGAMAYTATKTALVGIMKQLAGALAPQNIRVNTVHPTGVMSGMTMNDAMAALMAQAAAGGDNTISEMQNALPVAILQPEDVANAVAFLVSEEGRYITGVAMPVDAGFCIR
jgi:SDR family mycofactocin-dependent oxidoreductase